MDNLMKVLVTITTPYVCVHNTIKEHGVKRYLLSHLKFVAILQFLCLTFISAMGLVSMQMGLDISFIEILIPNAAAIMAFIMSSFLMRNLENIRYSACVLLFLVVTVGVVVPSGTLLNSSIGPVLSSGFVIFSSLYGGAVILTVLVVRSNPVLWENLAMIKQSSIMQKSDNTDI